MSTTVSSPPSGPRRGSYPRRGGGHAGTRNGPAAFHSSSQHQQDQDSLAAPDTEEVRALRSKYSDKLDMIRELFPDWTDEDLLFALQEANGELELAVGRISEGEMRCRF